jgi:hypothetical protein
MSDPYKGLPVYSNKEAYDLILSSERNRLLEQWEKLDKTVEGGHFLFAVLCYVASLESALVEYFPDDGLFRKRPGLPMWRAGRAKHPLKHPYNPTKT